MLLLSFRRRQASPFMSARRDNEIIRLSSLRKWDYFVSVTKTKSKLMFSDALAASNVIQTEN